MADAFNTSVPGTDLAPKRPIRAVRARFGSVRVPPANLGAWHRLGLVQLNEHGPIEQFPAAILGDNVEHALLFKRLATLRTETELFDDVESLRWAGPTPEFGAVARQLDDRRLADRAAAAAGG